MFGRRPPPARTREPRLLVWTIVASQFAPPFMFSGVAVALPTMGADLGAGATALGLVETLFLSGHLAFLLPIGRLAESGDRPALYRLGLAGFGVSSILIGGLSWLPAILALRFVQGIASAIFAAIGPALLADIVPAAQRGRAYGRSLGAIYGGLTLGPITAGFLIDLWGWRAVFGAGAAAVLVGYLLVRAMLPSSWRRPVPPHLPSVGLVAAAVLALVAGSAMVGEGLAGPALLLGGLALAAVFVGWQRRLARPLVDVDALGRNRVLRNALLVQLLLYVSAFSSVFMLSIYMQVSLGHSARLAGQVLAVGTVIMAVMAPVAGALADRYRPSVVSTVGVAAALGSALMARALDERSSLVAVALVLAVQGLGFALFSSPNLTIVMNSVPARALGMASALAAKARSLGMVSGMLVTALLISLEIGHDPVRQHGARFVGIMGTAFSVLAALSAVALVLCLVTRRTPPPGLGDLPGIGR
jgi:MFS family permease